MCLKYIFWNNLLDFRIQFFRPIRGLSFRWRTNSLFSESKQFPRLTHQLPVIVRWSCVSADCNCVFYFLSRWVNTIFSPTAKCLSVLRNDSVEKMIFHANNFAIGRYQIFTCNIARFAAAFKLVLMFFCIAEVKSKEKSLDQRVCMIVELASLACGFKLHAINTKFRRGIARLCDSENS